MSSPGVMTLDGSRQCSKEENFFSPTGFIEIFEQNLIRPKFWIVTNTGLLL